MGGEYVHIYFGFEENAKCSERFKGRTAVFAPRLPSPTRYKELKYRARASFAPTSSANSKAWCNLVDEHCFRLKAGLLRC